MCTHLQIRVEADGGGGREGEGQEVGERVPEPELGEHEHAHDGRHVGVTRPWLQRYRHVATTCTWIETHGNW